MVNQATLHYFFDPLCGWCYGAAPLLHAAATVPGLQLQLHGGGMMSGANRQQVSAALRQYVMPHDARIAALTGQPFGDAYFNGLLLDSTALFDSTPPTLAILAARTLAADPLAMLARIQHAHYAEGRRIADHDVLLALAAELGLDRAAFAAAMQAQAGAIDDHLRDTRQRMASHGLRGFPSLLLTQGGQSVPLDLSAFLGQPQAFVTELQQRLQTAAVAAADSTGAAFCTPDGCH